MPLSSPHIVLKETDPHPECVGIAKVPAGGYSESTCIMGGWEDEQHTLMDPNGG